MNDNKAFMETFPHTFVIESECPEAAMFDSDCETIEIQKQDIKISMIFPAKTNKEEDIRKDIKAILSNALREQVTCKLH